MVRPLSTRAIDKIDLDTVVLNACFQELVRISLARSYRLEPPILNGRVACNPQLLAMGT